MTSKLSRAALYFHTLRSLRWEQLIYRPIRRVQARLPVRASVSVTADPARTELLARAVRSWWGERDRSAHLRRAREVLDGTFRFLNRAETIDPVDWSRRYVSHLWSYNLHYFDYAVDLALAWCETGDERFVERFATLAESWIRDTEPGRGDGWEPYPLSLRTVNWIYSLLLFGDALDGRRRARVEASLGQQLAVLEKRLEFHILANHLQKNLKALVIGGLYFEGATARRWLDRGLRLLWRELFEQVLPDGGHYERSPMYHAIALADFLEVISLLDAIGVLVPPEVRARVSAMVDAFAVLSRPDGTLHLFNDAANGIAPTRPWIDRLSRLAIGREVPEVEGVFQLPATGYYGTVDRANGDRIIVDCGEPGPSYQPGHAHCDLLSFELDLGGRPVVVDSGVHGYEGDPFREYSRSTRAHNTVMIAGREQSEVWGTFRVARRAVVRGARVQARDGEFSFVGECSPYHDRNTRHRREIRLDGDIWSVVDRVDGGGGLSLQSFLHLHPDFDASWGPGHILARAQGLSIRIEPFGFDEVVIKRGDRDPIQGWYFSEFGHSAPAPVIEMRVANNDGRVFGYRIARAW